MTVFDIFREIEQAPVGRRVLVGRCAPVTVTARWKYEASPGVDVVLVDCRCEVEGHVYRLTITRSWPWAVRVAIRAWRWLRRRR